MPKYDTYTGRSKDDEIFMKALNNTSDLNQNLYIFNHAEKKVFKFPQENSRFYDRIKTIVYNMNDNKLVGQALEQMWAICQNIGTEKSKVMARIEKSKWYKLIGRMIKAANKVRNCFMEITETGYQAKNVLIYCQSGAGPSSVLVSLAQILIDPYYRTFQGFRALIQKDWVYYGHNFYRSCNLCKYIHQYS